MKLIKQLFKRKYATIVDPEVDKKEKIIKSIVRSIFSPSIHLPEGYYAKSKNEMLKEAMELLENKSYNQPIILIEEYLNDISTYINSLEDENEAFKEQLGLKNISEIDSNLFETKTFACKWNEIMLESSSLTEHELKLKFNDLLQKEIYFVKGILAAIDYTKNLKKKHKPMYVQLFEYFFTTQGKDKNSSLIN